MPEGSDVGIGSHISVNPVKYIDWSSSSYSYPCNYVFMVKEGYFIFSEPEDLKISATLQGTCQQAANTSFCGEKSRCSNNGPGYSCKCLDGFEGNPYAQHGCKDVDECKVNVHSCGKHQTCKNVDGTFRCKKKKEWTKIILLSVIGCLVGVCCVLLKLKFRQLAKLRERRFESTVGAETPRVTESVYQDIHRGRDQASHSRHETSFLGGGGQGVSHSRSKDLETGTLTKLGSSLTKSYCFPKSTTLTYLHFSAPVSIVHRDNKPENILLTQTLSVKLCDFGSSRPVPTRTGQLTTLVQGTWGYLDPEYLRTQRCYSFGVVLLELLSGEKAISFNPPHGERVLVSHIDAAFKGNRLSEVMDQRVVTDDNQAVIHQVALLGLSCTRMCGVERPDMRRVAEDLRGLQASGQVVLQDEAGPSGSAFEIEEIN
ncbi:LOW QUALITY PROTEIN: hypothetical protein HID58_063719 [Brassica napus]|uniref:Protein kinase domain-containing protein n=1 Tax=Brassica napus TaxID=3708 RepID=A0ABQ7XFE1_BRANA|nr:LOW QUALITY PROTEIN: hypothetical protein HID58_063719 [Brassica napus]